MSDFVSFPLFGFNLVVKPRNFDFKANGQEIFLWNPQKSSVNVCLLKTLKKKTITKFFLIFPSSIILLFEIE